MGSRGAPSPRRIECRCQTGSRSRRKAARARTAAMTGAPDLDAMTAAEFVAYLDDLDRAENTRTPEKIWRPAKSEERRVGKSVPGGVNPGCGRTLKKKKKTKTV